MSLPLMAAGIGLSLLAQHQQKADARKQAKAQIYRDRVNQLGGNTSVIDAAAFNKQQEDTPLDYAPFLLQAGQGIAEAMPSDADNLKSSLLDQSLERPFVNQDEESEFERAIKRGRPRTGFMRGSDF